MFIFGKLYIFSLYLVKLRIALSHFISAQTSNPSMKSPLLETVSMLVNTITGIVFLFYKLERIFYVYYSSYLIFAK